MEARRLITIIGLIFLGFFAVPIQINTKNSLTDDEVQFKDYIKKFNKSYEGNESEYKIRFENFKESLKQIDELNRNRTNNYSALYGLTVYSDLSKDEFMVQRLQINISSKSFHYPSSEDKQRLSSKLLNSMFHKHHVQVNISVSNSIVKKRKKRAVKNIPKKVDWREKGVISAIRNQRMCGACWAFSTIQTVEAMKAIRNGSLEVLSVQEVIDCAKNGNHGCEGGDACSLLEWLVSNKVKIATEKSYPFTYETQACKLAPKDGIQIKSYSCDNLVGSEDLIQEKLANHGPVAAAVNAINWQYYLGGIIQFHCSGAPDNLNHAVQIVGYDLTAPVPHYIVKNSWGVEFGDKGYMYIAVGGNICGIADEVSSLDIV